MADRPAAIHWEIARKIVRYARSGSTDDAAVYWAFDEYRNIGLTEKDIGKISTVLDKISMKQAGYWHGLLNKHSGLL